MYRLIPLRRLAPALALAGAAALGGCVAYPAPYATTAYGYGGYYEAAPYGYTYPAYQPAPLFGFSFSNWGNRGDWGWHHRGHYWR